MANIVGYNYFYNNELLFITVTLLQQFTVTLLGGTKMIIFHINFGPFLTNDIPLERSCNADSEYVS